MGRYFISGIGTGVGKTFISAILTEALKADYWKPIQCGTKDGTDKQTVSSLVSNTTSVFHPESYCYDEPVSPHMAAAIRNERIRSDGFEIPLTDNEHLIVEGAGGLMVPLNDDTYVVELSRFFETDIILVCRNYLGCINHSLLSLDFLLKNDYPVKGIILNGKFDKEVRSAIVNFSELPVLAEIPEITEINKEVVLHQAGLIDLKLFAD
ncbi:MAG: bioD [Bacteroidetes bacterium]|jgi:dethiobiotin synthetase|nr:bioD [Bacteroidota bacterium]